MPIEHKVIVNLDEPLADLERKAREADRVARDAQAAWELAQAERIRCWQEWADAKKDRVGGV